MWFIHLICFIMVSLLHGQLVEPSLLSSVQLQEQQVKMLTLSEFKKEFTTKLNVQVNSAKIEKLYKEYTNESKPISGQKSIVGALASFMCKLCQDEYSKCANTQCQQQWQQCINTHCLNNSL